eukprot:gene5026-6255_t
MFPNAKIGRIAQEIVGFVLVFFISTLIFVAVFLWYTIFFPYYWEKKINVVNLWEEIDNKDGVGYFFHLSFVAYLVFQIYYYYYHLLTVSTFATIPNKSEKREEFERQYPAESESQSLFCRYCKALKRPGSKTHHCRICKRCTTGMDHHCPFISNCVGSKNHHHFIIFLCMLLVGVGYACFLSYFPFRDCLMTPASLITPDQLDLCYTLSKYNYIFICASLVEAPIVAILIWQFYVVHTDTTTVELLQQLKISPTYSIWFKYLWKKFKSGSLKNWKNVFGGWTLLNLIIPLKINNNSNR